MAYTERDLEHLDPLRLDREIARLASLVRSWRRRIARGDSLDEDPFWSARLVAGRSAFHAAGELGTTDPLREPIRRWVFRLAEQRINRAAIARTSAELCSVERVVSAPERVRLPLRALLNRAISEPARRDAWLDSFLSNSGDLGTATAILWERRREMAARMGVDGPDTIESLGADVARAASAWLDRTRDIAREVGGDSLSEVFRVSLAEGAHEGWPRHLLPRTLMELLRGTDLFRDVALDPDPLPNPRAPASFARAFARIGEAWVDATAPADQPFVVAHDPFGLRRRTMGRLFAALPATETFARRPLGQSGAKLSNHVRIMNGALLVDSRLEALRVLLREAALEGRRALGEAFERDVERTLGFVLPREAAGALFRFHADTRARFAGLLSSASLAARLRESYDEDWHRNPRAAEQLRDEARLSPEVSVTDDALEHGASALAERLSSALG